MNPLNVLRGTSLMTPAASLRREDDAVLLDAGPSASASTARITRSA